SIELLLAKLQSQEFSFFKVKVISGAGQYLTTMQEFGKLIGEPDVLVCISGLKDFERFTGNQNLKICLRPPSLYLQTSRISL
ncbi:20746_t:CDS:2, partial [Racocetra persica]